MDARKNSTNCKSLPEFFLSARALERVDCVWGSFAFACAKVLSDFVAKEVTCLHVDQPGEGSRGWKRAPPVG